MNRLRSFRTRFVLQEPVRSPDGLGGFSVTWQQVAVIWGALGQEASAIALTATEGGQPAPRHVQRIIVRRHNGFRIGRRLLRGNRAYLIQGVEDNGEGYSVTLKVEEAVI